MRTQKMSKKKALKSTLKNSHERITTRTSSHQKIDSNDLSHLVENPPYFDFSSSKDYERFMIELNHRSSFPIEFILQKNDSIGNFAHIEQDLLIAPVALLQKCQQDEKCFGVFAKKDLKSQVELCLGEYIGEVKDDQSIHEKSFDSSYAFDLSNGKTIDAKNKRGWPAMVNATSSYQSSNVVAKRSNDHIYYYLTRPIKAGEQLLIYYGDEYQFRDKRFLNPSDNWEESIDKYKKYQYFYKSNQPIDDALIRCLGLPTSNWAIPDSALIDQCSRPDIPCLAYQTGTLAFLPQNKQENITLLMLACWQGNVKLVEDLLAQGSNPYQQTSIHGYSAIHFITLSPHLNPNEKENLMEIILNDAKGALILQDLHDDTALHHAIRSGQLELTKAMLESNKRISKYNTKLSLLDCMNQEDKDAFILAITSNFRMVEIVLPFMEEPEIDYFLENPESIQQAFEELSKFETKQQIRERIQCISDHLRVSKKDKSKFIQLLIGTKSAEKMTPKPNDKKKRDTFFTDQVNPILENNEPPKSRRPKN